MAGRPVSGMPSSMVPVTVLLQYRNLNKLYNDFYGFLIGFNRIPKLKTSLHPYYRTSKGTLQGTLFSIYIYIYIHIHISIYIYIDR